VGTAETADLAERRRFAQNVLGTLAQTLTDRVGIGAGSAAGLGAHGPAALVTLFWYPDRPIKFLAERLRISHPGAAQLVTRLEEAGLVERIRGEDARIQLLVLTDAGYDTARSVLAARREVMSRAVGALDDSEVDALVHTVERMLEALTDDLLTSEFMCRMCDERTCPDDWCPVEKAEPTPSLRRGAGYGVTNVMG
jgi:DNA-binding MarR family transcriptional regulator